VLLQLLFDTVRVMALENRTRVLLLTRASFYVVLFLCYFVCSVSWLPRAGSGVVSMDPLRFLAGCRTR